MARAFRIACGIGAMIALFGCEGHGNAPSAPGTAMHDVSVTSSPPGQDYVATPAGWFHKSCVHEIPAGARVSRANLVTRSDGTKYQIPACAYKAYPNFGHASQHSNLGPATDFEPPSADTGWVEYAYTVRAYDVFRNLAASWTVPSAPTSTYSGVKTFYQFPGLENDAFIVQPVIQYGYNGDFGGNYWSAASWHCDGPSGICDHSTPITIYAGNAIYGTAAASGCIAGECTWTITTVDVTTGGRSVLAKVDSDNYQFATGGAMETHGSFTSCSDFPANGTQFSGVSLYTATGPVTPTWAHSIVSSPSPSCGFDVVTTSDSVRTIVNPPPPSGPTISIDGPTQIRPGATCIWEADVSGGTSPYTYDWHMGTTDEGSGDSIDASKPAGLGSPFNIYLDVWGSDGGHSSTHISVTESSTAPICPN